MWMRSHDVAGYVVSRTNGLGDQPRYVLLEDVTAITVPEWTWGVQWVQDNTLASGDCVVATGFSDCNVALGTS